MKKALAFAFVLVMCLTTAACGANPGSSNSQETTVESSTEKPTDKVTEESTVVKPTPGTEESADEIVEKTSTLDVEPSTVVPEDNTWKKLYIDFINSLDDSKISGYQLIFIDDDDIPELTACGISHIVPSYLCWVNDGKLCQGSMSFSGFAYLEKHNRYICEEGFTGKGWDYVRRINGDEAEDLITGELCTVQGHEYYRWNGLDYPNQDEYEAAMKKDFNKDEAQKVDNLKTYSEICAQIRDY